MKHLQAPGMPKLITEGLKLMGTKEIVGNKHNPIILGWARELGIEKIYTNDEMPWCSLYMAYVAKKAGKEVLLRGYELLRALDWVRFGTRPDEAMLGDVMIFKRPEGGHVGINCGESKDAYLILGGNQSNMVSLTWMPKMRFYAVRRPIYQNQPASVKKVLLNRDGSLSQNEA